MTCITFLLFEKLISDILPIVQGVMQIFSDCSFGPFGIVYTLKLITSNVLSLICQNKHRVGGRMLPPGQNAATPNALVREIDQSRLSMPLPTRDNFLFLKFGT